MTEHCSCFGVTPPPSPGDPLQGYHKHVPSRADISQINDCVVPENIHTPPPPTDGFLVYTPHPLGISPGVSSIRQLHVHVESVLSFMWHFSQRSHQQRRMSSLFPSVVYNFILLFTTQQSKLLSVKNIHLTRYLTKMTQYACQSPVKRQILQVKKIKTTRKHCCRTLLWRQMFPGLVTWETFVAETNFASQKKYMLNSLRSKAF